ncbi:hypothetical protein LXL04_023773 [Taraxacum kok-saghyz]
MHIHMRHSTSELANRISRALIAASHQSDPPRTWTPVLEQTLHGIGCRHSLNPTLVSRVIDPFLIHHHSLALGFFNWASQQPGFTHSSISYQSILKSLSISRQSAAVDTLMKQVKTSKIQLNPSLYRSIIASHIAAKRSLNAFSVFNDVRFLVPDIGPDTCNSLVAALSSAGNLGYTHQVFDQMTTRHIRLSTLGIGVFLWKFSRTAELDKTLSFLDDVKTQNPDINGSILALLILHGLSSENRVHEAMYMLDLLRKKDCKPDFMAYRIVAEAMRATGNIIEVEQVLKLKRKLGVAPRTSDYRDFIFQLISERLITEAKELGEIIINGNFPIEDDVLNALIGSVSTTDSQTALIFFKFLLSKQRFPTLLTLNNLCKNLCKHGTHDELVEIFKILSANDYFMDIERYNIIILYLCKSGKVKEAYDILQEMKRKGVGPDISCYNHVMEGCCTEDMIRPAKRLWDEMFANGCGPNLITYNILIKKLSEIGQVKEGHRVFRQMLEREVVPDGTTYVSLLKGLCQEKEVETALDIFKKCFENNPVIAQGILGKFVFYLCKEGEFIVGSKLVDEYGCSMGDLEANMMLLKGVVDGGEISIGIEHVKRVGEKSPLLLKEIRCEVLSWLSSSSPKSQLILELVRAIESFQQNRGRHSNQFSLQFFTSSHKPHFELERHINRFSLQSKPRIPICNRSGGAHSNRSAIELPSSDFIASVFNRSPESRSAIEVPAHTAIDLQSNSRIPTCNRSPESRSVAYSPAIARPHKALFRSDFDNNAADLMRRSSSRHLRPLLPSSMPYRATRREKTEKATLKLFKPTSNLCVVLPPRARAAVSLPESIADDGEVEMER